MMEIPADLHPEVAPLAFLLGTWQGVGVGDYPTIEGFRFGQEVVFEQYGLPYLSYSSRTWLLDDDGNQVRPLAAERGFWRVHDGERVEVMLAHPTGIVELWLGRVDGVKVEIATDAVARSETAKEYNAGHRLYGLVQSELMYAFDMAAMGQPLQPHVSARLKRA